MHKEALLAARHDFGALFTVLQKQLVDVHDADLLLKVSRSFIGMHLSADGCVVLLSAARFSVHVCALAVPAPPVVRAYQRKLDWHAVCNPLVFFPHITIF